MSRTKRGFTLVELLVVIGILGLLLAILLPVFAGVREKSVRTVCASNLHQFYLALYMYDSENHQLLPSGVRNLPPVGDGYEHVPWISDAMHDSLTQIVTSPVLSCPNFSLSSTPGDFIYNYQQEPYGWVIGYNYLGGHTSKNWPGDPWVSANKFTDQTDMPVACDFTFLSSGISWAPHGKSGLLYGKPYTMPQNFGCEGGNAAYRDGSVQWKRASDMKKWSADQGGYYFFAW